MQEKIKTFREKILRNSNLNFYISEIKDEHINFTNKGELSNFCYAIKDNISFKDYPTTGGSKFLKNYIAPYNATVINLLNDAGAIPLIKTNLDEFGLGGTGTFSFNGNVVNPIDDLRISGGSSSGSAVATFLDVCDFALGTDTGDSIRRPASYLGIIGYKPTYGLISRYGVLPYAPSFDHVGLFSKSINIIQKVMSIIAKHDPKDFSSQNISLDFLNHNLKLNLKIAIISEVFLDINDEIKNLFNNTVKKIKNIEINKVNFDNNIFSLIPSVYKIISYSEAVSCYQNMTGITFGENMGGNNFEDMATKNRTNFFGDELKRRFIIGSFCTSEENYEELFLKSKKIRTLIINETNKIFENNDFIISLGASNIAPLLEDIKNKNVIDKNADYYLQIANFGGFPSITLPMGNINGMPIGINIMGKLNSDVGLLEFAKRIIENQEMREEKNV